jgi:predicted transcriptional regulator
MTMEKEGLIALTAEIVATQVANNQVAVGDLSGLVQKVYGALAGLDVPSAAAEPEKRATAVPVRASVKPDHLVCLACGRKQKTLKRHLKVGHNLTPWQYRAEFGLPESYPMTAPKYSERRSELAKVIGLGRARGRGRAGLAVTS